MTINNNNVLISLLNLNIREFENITISNNNNNK